MRFYRERGANRIQVKGWLPRRVSRMAVSEVPAVLLPPSTPPPVLCGAIDRLSDAVCSKPAHSDRRHVDSRDPQFAWTHDRYTLRRAS